MIALLIPLEEIVYIELQDDGSYDVVFNERLFKNLLPFLSRNDVTVFILLAPLAKRAKEDDQQLMVMGGQRAFFSWKGFLQQSVSDCLSDYYGSPFRFVTSCDISGGDFTTFVPTEKKWARPEFTDKLKMSC